MSAGRYVYGVVSVDHARRVPEAMTGVDGAPVALVELAGVAVACSAVETGQAWEADLDQLEDRLRAHQRVIDRLFEAGAVVPVRFGTVFASDEAMQRWVEGSRDVLERTLRSIDGLAEWVLTVSWDLETAREHIAPVQPATGGTGAGAAYLRARATEQSVAERLEHLRDDVAHRLHQRASACARTAERLPAPPSADGVVLRARYVVARDEVDAFASAVGATLADERPCVLRADLSGPWPPLLEDGDET